MDAKTFEKYKTTPFYALEVDKRRKYQQFMQAVQQEYDWLAEVLKEIPAMLPQDEFMVLPAKTPGKRKVRGAVAEPIRIDLDDSGDPPSSPASSQPPLSIQDLESEPKHVKKNGRVLRSLRSRAIKNRVSISKKKTKKLSSHSRTCTYSPRHIKASPSASSTPDKRDGDKRKQRTLRLKRTAAVKRLYLTPDKRKMFEESLNSLKAHEKSQEEVLAGMTSTMSSPVPLSKLVTEGKENEKNRVNVVDQKAKKTKESKTVVEDVGLTTIDNYVTAIESPITDSTSNEIIVKECRIIMQQLSPTLVKRLQLSIDDTDEDESSTTSSIEEQSQNSESVVSSQPSRPVRSSRPVNETVTLPQTSRLSQSSSPVNEMVVKSQSSRSSRSSRPVNVTVALSQPITSPHADILDDKALEEDVDVIVETPEFLSKTSNLVSSTPEKNERKSLRLSRKRSSHHANLTEAVASKKIALDDDNDIVGRESAFVEADEADDVIAPLAAPTAAKRHQSLELEPDSFITDDEWDTIDDESVSIVNPTKASICTPQNSGPRNGLSRLAHSADGNHHMKKMKKWKTHGTTNMNSSLDMYKKGSKISRISNTSTPGRLQKTPKERLSQMADERRRELRERMRKEMQRMKEREERVAKEREARRIANEKRRQMVLSKRNEMELMRERKEEEQRKKAAIALARRQQEDREREEADRRVRRQREEIEKKAKEEAERRQREVERKAKEEVERRLKEAEKKAKEEAEKRQREAERKAKEIERRQKEAEQRVKEEMERRARMETERKAKEEAERRAKLEAERRARVEADRKAREEAYKRALEEERKMASLKHQHQMAVLKASSRMNVPDSAPSKPKKFSNSEHYDISDLHSDQETDDDEQPRKKVPVWATRSAMLSLCRHVRRQETKWWTVFRPADTVGVDLSQMFSESTRQFRSRTSSAVWDIPPALRSNRPYL